MNIITKEISLLLFADLAIIVTLLKERIDVSRFETSHSNSDPPQSPHAESLKELVKAIVSSDEQSNPGYSQIKIGSGRSQLKFQRDCFDAAWTRNSRQQGYEHQFVRGYSMFIVSSFITLRQIRWNPLGTLGHSAKRVSAVP